MLDWGVSVKGSWNTGVIAAQTSSSRDTLADRLPLLKVSRKENGLIIEALHLIFFLSSSVKPKAYVPGV